MVAHLELIMSSTFFCIYFKSFSLEFIKYYFSENLKSMCWTKQWCHQVWLEASFVARVVVNRVEIEIIVL